MHPLVAGHAERAHEEADPRHAVSNEERLALQRAMGEQRGRIVQDHDIDVQVGLKRCNDPKAGVEPLALRERRIEIHGDVPVGVRPRSSRRTRSEERGEDNERIARDLFLHSVQCIHVTDLTRAAPRGASLGGRHPQRPATPPLPRWTEGPQNARLAASIH